MSANQSRSSEYGLQLGKLGRRAAHEATAEWDTDRSRRRAEARAVKARANASRPIRNAQRHVVTVLSSLLRRLRATTKLSASSRTMVILHNRINEIKPELDSWRSGMTAVVQVLL